MFTGDQLQGLGETELRALAQSLLKEIDERDAVIAGKDAEIAHTDLLAQVLVAKYADQYRHGTRWIEAACAATRSILRL